MLFMVKRMVVYVAVTFIVGTVKIIQAADPYRDVMNVCHVPCHLAGNYGRNFPVTVNSVTNTVIWS
jgi:hypothetical protein